MLLGLQNVKLEFPEERSQGILLGEPSLGVARPVGQIMESAVAKRSHEEK